MGKKKDKKREAKLDELGRRAAEFADETPSPANERKPKRGSKRDFSYTQNREVSWLRFDDRVLDEAFDETVPLFERIKFCAIFQSNMDEWFMIRIGGLSDLAELKHQPADNKSDETPAEQLESVFGLLPGMYKRRESCLTDLEARLALEGVERVSPAQYTDADLVAVSRRFEASLAPILSPIIIDPRHPFPNLRNDVMYVACSLDGVDEHDMLGIVEVPPTAARIVWLPSGEGRVRYTLVEDVVSSMLSRCFGSYVPTSSAVVRVTRNADIDPDGEGVEEEEDYRQHMKKVLKRRSRLQPVRLELTGALDESLVTLVRKELGLEKRRVFRLSTPADLSYVYALENRLPATRKAVLTFTPFEPQPSPMVNASRPMRDQIEDHDVLLTYPYESMGPLLRLIHEAANDDACISIKITLYRVARHSRLCESLVAAVENGKDVTVLMELRARFDEQNNIEWAERLEEAGCTVIYGSEGFKCHSKICQITYHDNRGLSRVTCLGTGNFNEKTARLYSDFMLITAHPGIAEDGNAFFRNLSLGNLRGTYRFLGVAPLSLKPLVMGGIDREIARARAGEPARVFLKMNSLTDRDVIDRLADASQAGVEVVMIIRGICCMLPGVKGRTTGIEIRQIVGRLLEHARIYSFGVDADTIYLSSADMMTRNTERRVEIAYPVLDPTCRRIVCDYMALQLSDNVKARRLTSKGTWAPIKRREGEPAINCQEQLMARAYARAHELEPQAVAPLAPEPMPTTTMAAVDETVAATEATEAVAPVTAAAKAKQVEQVDQAAAAKHGPAVTPMAQPAIEDEPEPAAHVEAHVIEDEQPTQSKTADADASREQPAAPGTLAKRTPGRLARALAIFGLGFKTLFGKDEQR
ncbi:polyphosphate kinase 1 [uncultured Parolsenella sp.]|uniref:polyphosphate kinase 1 n=1 Tax=uncultured Parolsenella sp. TaxID=2083008 RepID=UPI0025D74983|nr:polyphosphate kinase 1 [uncultured Parolsenella sp.]